MSRIGRAPINIPAGVNVEVNGRVVKVTGPKGTLEAKISREIKIEVAESTVTVKPVGNDQSIGSFGLSRTLIDNMVKGVTDGFSRSLEIHGVGYRASVAGSNLNLSLGFSHPIEFKLPEGIEAKVEKNIVTIAGADKYIVGQVAADIRSLRKPEPYKGKGIRYVGEHVRRKAGKAAVKGAS